MKAKELIDFLNNRIEVSERTCDTVKAGNSDKDIVKVAIAMNPTAEVLTLANEWNADMLIVHEPLYFNHMDDFFSSAVTLKKKELAEKNGMVIYRYHDHPHNHVPDMINAGFISALGLEGKTLEKITGGYIFLCDKPISAYEVAKRAEEKLNIAHIRICGERDKNCTRFALCLGAPGDMLQNIIRDDIDCVIAGEVSEWRVAEYARDAAYLGINKSMLILGHVGSERDGMLLMKNELEKLFPALKFKYFENQEVYTYTDT